MGKKRCDSQRREGAGIQIVQQTIADAGFGNVQVLPLEGHGVFLKCSRKEDVIKGLQ